MTEHPPATTPERILAAAGEIFGQDGFKAATIRRIAHAAKANVASIHYHFGDKEGLYAAVLENFFQAGFSRFPTDAGLDATPEERLLAFVRSLLYRVLSREGWGGMAGPGRLIAREFLEPTPSFKPIIEKYIKPQKDILTAILSELLGCDAQDEILASCALSVIGQCLYSALRPPVVQRLAPRQAVQAEDDLDRLAAFVWQFSLGGIGRIRANRSIPAGG